MNVTIKTTPKEHKVFGQPLQIIEKVKGRLSDIPFSFKPENFDGLFYLEFLTKEGTLVEAVNLTKSNLIIANKEDKKAVNTIYKSLLSGTEKQRFSAIKKVLSVFDLTALPLKTQKEL